MPKKMNSAEALNAAIGQLRLDGASIDGDNAYKRDLLDTVVGAMAFGAQNTNSPPADHWGQRFWDIGRGAAAEREELLPLVKRIRSYLGQAGIEAKPESVNPLENLASDIDLIIRKYP